MAKRKKSNKSKGKNRAEIHYLGAPPSDKAFLSGITKLLPDTASEQFLVGLLIGAGATYVLSDEKLRRQIIRYALQVYGDVVGGLEELKEQVADIQAEIRVEKAAEP